MVVIRKMCILVPTSRLILGCHFHVENKLLEITAVQGCPRAVVSEGLKPVTTGIANGGPGELGLVMHT